MPLRCILVELPPAFFGDERMRPASEALLRSLLQFMVQANRLHLAAVRTPGIYESGVRYLSVRGARLSSIPGVIVHGGGACASLSCWRAAELQMRGERAYPVFGYVKSDTRYVYHVVVRRGDGSIEDPSARLGMRVPETRWAA